jgi:ferredoxin-NADP reductase
VYQVDLVCTAQLIAVTRRLAAPGTGLDIDIAYTRKAPAGWPGPVGRLDARQLRDLAGPPAAGQQYFISGPTGFVENAARLLVDQGIADRQIRTERFGPSGGTP